ncbi:hypothetical protein KM043_013865 [Ampulex compressa]|nr:hypothetical protein KM043_013865 [Ampulex compressa]
MTAPDLMLSCPFDNAHRIHTSKLPFHLVKCKQNHPFTTKLYCPFNSVHIVDKEQYEHHVQTCPNSGNVKIYKYSLEPVEKVESVPLQKLQEIEVPSMCTEDWDGNCTTYDPLHNIENRNIVRPLIVASKSRKKQFKKNERLRLSSLNENRKSMLPNKFNTRDTSPEHPLRIPRQPARVILLTAEENKCQTANKNVSGSGIGSGGKKDNEDKTNLPKTGCGSRNKESVPKAEEKSVEELSERMRRAEIGVKDEFKNDWITPSRKRCAGRGLAVACTMQPARE